MTVVAKRLKLLIAETGLSETQVAERMLGWEPRRLNQYTTGGRRLSLDNLVRICEVFNTHPNWLLGFSDSRTAPPEDRLNQIEEAVRTLQERVKRRP